MSLNIIIDLMIL